MRNKRRLDASSEWTGIVFYLHRTASPVWLNAFLNLLSFAAKMDAFNVTHAPEDYHAVKPIADLFVAGMGAGWIINYLGMVYISFQDMTYGMSIVPLCCNIAWEVVYSLIYPPMNLLDQVIGLTGLAINFVIIYSTIRSGPKEWAHAPFVRDHLGVIFAIGIIGCLTGHLALAAQIGHSLAYSWGAVICQLLLSVGGLCQLLSRSSTRGASYLLWSSRFLGSTCVVVFAFLRWRYWPECFSWLGGPLVLWSVAAFFTIDGSYGVCYWYVKKYEQRAGEKKKM